MPWQGSGSPESSSAGTWLTCDGNCVGVFPDLPVWCVVRIYGFRSELLTAIVVCTAIVCSTVLGPLLHSHAHQHAAADGCSSGGCCGHSFHTHLAPRQTDTGRSGAAVKQSNTTATGRQGPDSQRSVCRFGCRHHQHASTAPSDRASQNSPSETQPTDRSSPPPWQPHDHNCSICIVLAQCAVATPTAAPLLWSAVVDLVSCTNDTVCPRTDCPATARGPPAVPAAV